MRMIFVALILLVASTSFASDVTQLVFAQTSSAVTSTANLRITVMNKMRKDPYRKMEMQSFKLEPLATYNYFMTKSITFPVTDAMTAIQIEVDQDTTMKINSESAFKKILSAERYTATLE